MALPIVFLHGFLGNSASFNAIVQHLPGEVVTFAPALYGHSCHVENSRDHDFAREVSRLMRLVRGRFAAHRVHLVGYSLGARLGIGLLAQYPELVGAATLMSCRNGLANEEQAERRRTEDSRWAKLLGTVTLSEFLEIWEARPLFASMRRVDPSQLASLRAQRLLHNPKALAQALDALTLAKMPNYSASLALGRRPVTLMAGELDPKFVALSTDLVRQMPNGRLVVVSGVGHNLPLECPREVACIIKGDMQHAEC